MIGIETQRNEIGKSNGGCWLHCLWLLAVLFLNSDEVANCQQSCFFLQYLLLDVFMRYDLFFIQLFVGDLTCTNEWLSCPLNGVFSFLFPSFAYHLCREELVESETSLTTGGGAAPLRSFLSWTAARTL